MGEEGNLKDGRRGDALALVSWWDFSYYYGMWGGLDNSHVVKEMLRRANQLMLVWCVCENPNLLHFRGRWLLAYGAVDGWSRWFWRRQTRQEVLLYSGAVRHFGGVFWSLACLNLLWKAGCGASHVFIVLLMIRSSGIYGRSSRGFMGCRRWCGVLGVILKWLDFWLKE